MITIGTALFMYVTKDLELKGDVPVSMMWLIAVIADLIQATLMGFFK